MIIWIEISLNFVPEDLIDMSVLVQVMNLYRTGDKPLTKPMTTHFSDT